MPALNISRQLIFCYDLVAMVHSKLQLVLSCPNLAQIFNSWMVYEKNELYLPPTLLICVDVVVCVGGQCYFTYFSKNLALCLHIANISDLLLSDVLVSASNILAFSAMHRLQSFAPAIQGLHFSFIDQLILYGMLVPYLYTQYAHFH